MKSLVGERTFAKDASKNGYYRERNTHKGNRCYNSQCQNKREISVQFVFD